MSLSTKERTITTIALKQLKFGAAAFNKWRTSQRRRWLQLTDRQFDGWQLDGVNFTGIKLTGSSFQKASLKNASFVAANLNRANFTGADLTYADFEGARMYQTILDNSRAERVNFYGSLREGWSIKGIDCQICWITGSREEKPEQYDLFKPGEFESIYGGFKVRIAFTKGFEPIDLLALPFYAKEILDKFPDKKIVFAGLSALGSPPSLEFRFEDAETAIASTAEMQEFFEGRFPELRNSVREFADRQLSRKDDQVGELISTLKYLVESNKNLTETNKSLVETNKEPRTYIAEMNQFNQNQGIQGRNISNNKIVQLNLGDPSQLAQVAADLEKLLNLVKAIPGTSEQDKQALSEAADSAKNNDSSGMLKALKKAGGWLLDFSKGVGVELAAAALTKAVGL